MFFEEIGSFDKAFDSLNKLKNIKKEAIKMAEPYVDEARADAVDRFEYARGASLVSNLYGITDQNSTSIVIKKPTTDGFELTAQGEDVLYAEFGAGIHYNGSGMYPIPKPDDIDGIGEHGVRGRFNTWGYYVDDVHDRSHLMLTHGQKAYMPMYHARESIRKNVIEGFKNL